MADPRFAELAGRAVSAGGAQRQAAGRQLADHARSLADRLRANLPVHLGILAEGLALLPPVDEPVYLAYWAGGPLYDAPSGELHATVVAPYQEAWPDEASALEHLGAAEPDLGRHRVVVRVARSSAREVPSGEPGEPRLLYPWRTDTVVTVRGVGYRIGTGD